MKKILFTLCLIPLLMPALSAQALWDNFQDTRKVNYGFLNGVFIPYFENPDQSGVNTSRVAAEYIRNASELYDVILIEAQMADVSGFVSGAKQMSIDVWSPNVGTTIQITLENNILAQPANYPTGRHSEYLVTTTVANAWETLNFTFSNRPDATVADNNVNQMVLLFAPNTNTGDTYYWDNLMGPEFAMDPCDGVTPDPLILNDFECNQNVDFTFSHSGINFRRIANPDQTGLNTSSEVATYTRNGGEEFDVIIGKFNGNLDLSSNSMLKVDVWDGGSPTNVRLSLQYDDGMGGTPVTVLDIDAATSVSSAWETLTFDASAASSSTDINTFVLLFDPGAFTSDLYYFDNFRQDGATAIDDLLEKGSLSVFPNPSAGLTNWTYSLKSAGTVRLSVLDLSGHEVAVPFEGRQAAGSQQIKWDARGLASGMYVYRLELDGYAASGKLLIP